MTSTETESRVTKMASFLVVPASRSECAKTRAPGGQHQQPKLVDFQLALNTYQGDRRLSEEAIPSFILAFLPASGAKA